LETLSGGTFSRSLGSGGSNSFQMTENGGGFSTAGAPCTVNIGGNGDTLTWGDGVGTQLVGTLKLCSPTCTNAVTFLNPIDLCGGGRTIQVDANPNSTADYAVLAGAVGDSYGNGSLLKTGAGTLYIAGSDSNSYAGATTIMGTVVLAKTGGAIAIPAGALTLSETGDGTNTILQLNGNNEIDPGTTLSFSTPLAAARLELNGHAQTVAGLSGDSHAVVEGLFDNSGLNSDSTLMVNNAANCTFAGAIRDSAQGNGTGKVNLVKGGAGSLLLSGTASYSGATTINGGMLQVTGSTFASSGVNIGPAGTLYFNRISGYLGYANPITGSGLVQINQGPHGLHAGTGGNTALCGFAGTVSVLSGGVYLQSVAALGSGPLNLGNGAICDLFTSATTTFATPITLNGIGGAMDGTARAAIAGDGSGAAYTLTGQITLAASSDVGNSENNAPLTLSGKISGPGGLVIGKPGTVSVTQYGGVTIAGTDSNTYGGSTTINRGTLYLQKSGGAIAIPGNISIAPSDTSEQGNTYLILNGSNQIAPSATLSFVPVRAMNAYFELLGNQQTLAGISDSVGRGIIENAEQQSGVASTGTLTINNTANCSYGGYLRNGDLAANAASTGLLALVKSGPGTLTLLGGNCSAYTGGLTVNAGTLDYSGAGVLPGTPAAYPNGPTGPTSPATITPCPYTINGGTLKIGWLSASIGPLQITGGTLTGTGTLLSNAAYDVRGGRVDAVLSGGSSIGLTKSGPATALLTGGNSYAGRTTVAGGTLELASAAQSCVLSVGGADLQSGALVFDYAAGADPAAAIAGLLKTSCDNGHWDVGQFQDSTAALTGLTLGMVDNTSSHQVTVMATYPGDFNLDGVVDSKDEAILFANVFTGGNWQQGDANGDGVVNGLDRDLWYSHVGLPPLAAAMPAVGVTAVPEPATLALLSAALLLLLAYARKRRA
jgi:autotransporter-associated beta strand protein